MKKETQLSDLKEIRDLLKYQTDKIKSLADNFSLAFAPENKSDVWPLYVPAGMTIEKALVECKPLFSVWRWTDKNLDDIITSDRNTKKSYTIKFKANIEADENMKDLSANDLEQKGIQGITLLERILLELKYFKATGKHLDLENITLCAGSRYSDGVVPRCDWSGGKFCVVWCRPGDRDPLLRSRVVVS